MQMRESQDSMPHRKLEAGHIEAGQGRAGQGRAGQGRAGQGRAGQGRAGQGRAATSDWTACRSRAAAIPLKELGTHRTEK